ncbi:MAG: DNA-directed RNA polymerase subunit L [Thermoplasmata archaeon]|nr:MAG: DNA-directed RNA polymerase subunit L [Thermoplasmata archaeon]
MELRKIEHTDDTLELEVLGEGETLLHPLREKLLEDKKVELATYIMGHPELEHPRIFLKVRKGKPEDALKKALKSLLKEYEDFEKLVNKVSV